MSQKLTPKDYEARKKNKSNEEKDRCKKLGLIYVDPSICPITGWVTKETSTEFKTNIKYASLGKI